MLNLLMECSICLDKLGLNYKTLNCGHKFHTNCLLRLLNNKCPLCRQNIINKPVCNQDHDGYGYSPVCRGGSCRFCYGKPLNMYLNEITKN